MKKSRKAFSLVEITVGVIIAAVLLTVLMKLLTSGMKGSTKGIAHQANVEAASILMSQIEYDLLRASEIESPELNGSDTEAKWKFYYAGSGSGTPVTVVYEAYAGGGASRKVTMDSKTQETILAKGHDVKLLFTHFMATPAPSKYSKLGAKYLRRHAMWVELTVSTKHDKKVGEKETFTLKRLIVVRSHM